MTYEEAINYIYSRRKFQKSSGHERIARLLELMGNPQKKLRFVHVVGTNGKGSVSTALAEVLTRSGYKTGLFTSPFVVEFGERIKVDGEFIPKEEICRITEIIKEKTELMENQELYPTVFEVTTALGIAYFQRRGCDIVVLEAGIGGKKDSTNVIGCPEAAIITSVSLDHTEMLGDSVSDIAREKCGIIKDSCPMVSYPFDGAELGFIPQSDEAAKTISECCKNEGSVLFLPDTKKVTVIKSDLYGTHFSYGGLDIQLTLPGKHQIGNMLTVITACRVLREKGYSITDSAIEEGIFHFTIPGRTQVIEGEPTVILDGGHNTGCMKALKNTVKEYLSDRKITLLMSFMKDKDYEEAISIIAPLCNSVIFTVTDPIRGEKPGVLKAIAEKYCPDVYEITEPEKAFSFAKSVADKDVLIVSGSFYLVSEVRKFMS